MSKKENDAATVLTQMSQLVCPPTFDFSSYGLSSPEDDSLLDTDAIGATCTLQPSSVRDGLFPSLACDVRFDNSKNMMSDPYIGFDGAEHTYAANLSSSWGLFKNSDPKTCSSQESKNKPTVFECNICSKVFKTKQHYTTHTNFHLNKKPYVCEVCSKGFTTKSDLKRHNKVHNKKSVIQCEKCHATFRDLASKTRHQRKSVHICVECGKEYNRIDSFKDHLIQHQNKKLFKCEICDREFAYKSSYNRHLATHEDEKPKNLTHSKNMLKNNKSKNTKTKKIKNTKIKTTGKKKIKKSKIDKSSMKGASKNSKRISKKRDMKKEQLNVNVNTPDDSEEDINAIPILTSMAENAANTFSKSFNKLDNFPFNDSPVFPDISFNPTSNIDNDVITIFDDSSTEDDCESILSDDTMG